MGQKHVKNAFLVFSPAQISVQLPNPFSGVFGAYTFKGKTTILGLYSICLARLGVKTLWVTTEMNAEQLRDHISAPQYRRYCETDKSTASDHPSYRDLGIVYAQGPYENVEEIMGMLETSTLVYPELAHIVIDTLQSLVGHKQRG